MHAQPTIEWQVFEEEEEWEALCLEQVTQAAERLRPLPISRATSFKAFLWAAAVVVFMASATLGQQTWRSYTDSFTYVEREIEQVLALEAATLSDNGAVVTGQASATLEPDRGTIRSAWSPHLEDGFEDEVGRAPGVEIHSGERRGDVVLVQVLVMESELPWPQVPYRETRFYRQSEGQWQRTDPVASFWGELQTLESRYFRFEFAERDSETVATAAARLDAVYAALHRDLGLLPPQEQDKLTVEVLAEPSSHRHPVNWFFPVNNRMRIPSPALMQIPAQLTDADVLSDIITSALTYQLVRAAMQVHQLKAPWSLLISGLRQSLYREYNGLSPWEKRERSAIVYSDSPNLRNLTTIEMYYTSNGIYTAYKGNEDMASALFDYITTTYGKETRLEFIKQLGQHIGWGTLIPAVFGISAAEFEAGWQAYLAASYPTGESDAEGSTDEK